MVWLVEKKVVHHMFGLGFERVKIPVRVKFEFEVKDGAFVPDSLSSHTVYNRKALERRYPKLDAVSLESSVGKAVKNEIMTYLR
jgi:hypothetical protein